MNQTILKSINAEEDYYAVLELARDADKGSIKKAYYKLSLQLHPDKNPDNPNAKEMYQKVKLAYALFTDVQAKQTYDAMLEQKEKRIRRLHQLDEKKRKMREDLAVREQAAEQLKRKKVDPGSLNRSAEIERVRYENELRLRQMQVGQIPQRSEESTVICRWGSGKEFDELKLRAIFHMYGTIDYLVVRKRSAVVQFREASSSEKFKKAWKEHPGLEVVVTEIPESNESEIIARMKKQSK